MKFLDKMERRFGKYAVKNLMIYMSVLYGLGFLVSVINPALYYSTLCLLPSAVFKGEVWRLVTWLMYPPSTSMFFGLIMIYVYFMLGTMIERICGNFRFNVFLIGGILLHIIVVMLIYLFTGWDVILTPENLNMTILLAYMALIPDAVFFMFFIIPIKARYLGIIYLVLTAMSFVSGNIAVKIGIAVSLLNFAVFYFTSAAPAKLKLHKSLVKAIRKSEQVRNAAAVKMKPESGATRHKCAVCGRTELDDPNLEFRYCSKCAGEYEYCMDHLYTHIHVGSQQTGEER
jgi:hypothetical protein